MRSIQRFARRLQVAWRTLDGAVLPAIALACAVAAAGLSAAAPGRSASTPSGYLVAAQNADGGFGPAPGQPSTALFAGWAALGLAAANDNPAQVTHGGLSVLDYVRAGATSTSDVGALERTILVAAAAGVSARSFGGHDLVAELQAEIRSDGSVSEQVNLTSFAVLALRAASVGPTQRTLAWLARQQNPDGGFSFATGGGGSDVDDTGAALEALGRDSNAQSTAWAVQGLLAAGVDPGSLRYGSPLAYLRSLIASDGHVRYSRSEDQTPVWVTAQALMALEGKALPLAAAARPAVRTTPSAGPHRTTVQAGGSKRAARGATRAIRRRHRGFTAPRSSITTPWLSLAAAAGIATALVLAPVGLG